MLVPLSNTAISKLTQALIDEITAAPEAVQREVFDFLVFLKARQAAREDARCDMLPLAHSAWAADWNAPEEDEAWREFEVTEKLGI